MHFSRLLSWFEIAARIRLLAAPANEINSPPAIIDSRANIPLSVLRTYADQSEESACYNKYLYICHDNDI